MKDLIIPPFEIMEFINYLPFDEWMRTVEHLVYSDIGLYLEDLPDENFRMNYEDNMSPEEMALIITENINDMISETIKT